VETHLEAGSRSTREDVQQEVHERDSLYGRTLGPGWVEVEPGIFVQRDGEHVLPPYHAD
jgi:hypothetical protein